MKALGNLLCLLFRIKHSSNALEDGTDTINIKNAVMEKRITIFLVLIQMKILGVAQTPKDSCSIPKDSLCQECTPEPTLLCYSIRAVGLFCAK
jgi:hypothetical protein